MRPSRQGIEPTLCVQRAVESYRPAGWRAGSNLPLSHRPPPAHHADHLPLLHRPPPLTMQTTGPDRMYSTSAGKKGLLLRSL